MIRTQLVLPENSFLSAQTYNEMFTMHGTTMIFLAVMPLNVGLANYVIPLMLGANDMAFPHLSAFVITGALSVMCVGIVGVAAQAATD